ncbi:probable methylcrotonoyl-CoA carboxylase beta chain, mitochondrial isoform X2 [Mizuhopecten yessoensis]|nr:probable methylcrotonoyl-CoA carboxylase beta chain, mitochondrial isoform X2 [Mizuhopecten yessoensis]XP_021362701.1 probable methylcrotonoyl-CoA carboxylase beta chain, mitochondrial isoform X2 [Mizuhopecten yessoensis]
MIVANDATVKGGTVYPVTLKKQLRAQEIAEQNRLPTVYIVESGGGFLPLQADIFNPGGKTFCNEAVMSSMGIPQMAIVCGNCTAGGAYIPTMADQTAIVHRKGYIFLGGPPLVQAATGEIVTTEELGGATLHCSVSGCTDYFAENEEEALSTGRDMVATLNLEDKLPVHQDWEEPLYSSDHLRALVAKDNVINIYKVIARLVDGSRFHEFKKQFGPTMVTGFAHIKG